MSRPLLVVLVATKGRANVTTSTPHDNMIVSMSNSHDVVPLAILPQKEFY